MEILQYTSDILTPLTQFYNRLVADVPHCYPVNKQELADALSGAICQTDNDDDLEAETAFVAMLNGTVQAFIHVGYYESNKKENIGVIRFFGYKRGARNAGQTVLEKVEEYLKKFNVTHITAFSSYQYRFYSVEYVNLSNALDHVHALLGFNGYQPRERWVLLDWENYDVTPISSPIPVTITVDWKEGRGKLPNCKVMAHQDGEEVGECESVSGGEFSFHPDAQDWAYTEWIGVEDDFQGQGLGKYLLQYSLQEMYKIGYRHSAISTYWENYRAFLFYCNCGYKVVDRTYEFEKILSEVAV